MDLKNKKDDEEEIELRKKLLDTSFESQPASPTELADSNHLASSANNLSNENLMRITLVNEHEKKKNESKNNRKFLIVKLREAYELNNNPNTTNNTLDSVNDKNNNSPLVGNSNTSKANKRYSIGEWNFDDNLDIKSEHFSTPSVTSINNASQIAEESVKQDMNERLQHEIEETDDTFGSTFGGLMHINEKNHRENEGQDTITSLTNNIYKRQLMKIRRNASLRNSETDSSQNSLNRISSDSIGSSTAALNFKANPSVSVTSSIEDAIVFAPESTTSSKEKLSFFEPMLSVKNIFRSKESLFSRKSFLKASSSPNSIRMHRINDTKSIELNSDVPKTPNLTNNSFGFMNASEMLASKTSKRSSYKGSTKAFTSQRSINANNEKADKQSEIVKADHVMDVIEEAMDNQDKIIIDQNFIEKVANTVRIQQLKQQKRRNNAIKICLFAEIIVFVLVILFTVFFARTVINQIKTIHAQVKSNKQILVLHQSSQQARTNLFTSLSTLDTATSTPSTDSTFT
jgi:hypothetical protein